MAQRARWNTRWPNPYPVGVPRPGRANPLDDRVLTVLRERGQMTHVQLGEALGVDRLAVRQSLSRLQARDLVRFVGTTDAQRNWGTSAPESTWEAVPQESE